MNFDKTAQICMAFIIFISIIWIIYKGVFDRVESVIIDEKHFMCTDAIPDGLGTKCVNYHYIGVK